MIRRGGVPASLGALAAARLAQGAAASTFTTGPADYQPDVCADTPLRITFPSAPVLGASGSITVHDASGAVQDTINLADPASFTETVGGATDAAGNLHEFNYYPVIITGDTASIYLHHQLGYGQTYYVMIDPGAFTGFAGISSPRAWRFTTRPRPPRAGSDDLTVNSGGRGDFCTVQGAINFVPAGNTRPVLITVVPGRTRSLTGCSPASRSSPCAACPGTARSSSTRTTTA